MRWLALVVLGACSFSPGALAGDAGEAGDDVRVDGAGSDATPDVSADTPAQPAGHVRSIDINDAQVSGGPHTDFPLLVQLTETWLRSATNLGDVARDDGFDIYFSADQLGVTRYPFEVESYNAVTGELIAWVKLPLAASTVLYLHYGDPANATNLATPVAVWTAGYELVAHFNGGGDSTGKNTLTGGALTQTTGIGPARSFDGVTSTVNAGSNAAVDEVFTGGGVIEGWFFADTYGGGGFGRLFDKNTYSLFVDTTNPNTVSALTFYHTCSTGNLVGYWHWNNINMVIGAWHHVALVYNKDAATNSPVAFIDGVLTTSVNSTVASGTMNSDGAQTIYFGQRANGDRGFDGILDEMRLASVVQSDGWYVTQYRNHVNPAAFFTVSTPL